MSALKIWESAIPLKEAYCEFADPFQHEKYRNARGIGPMLAFKKLMFADIFARLATGELIAFGFRTLPTPGTDPELIPRHCFMVADVTLARCDEDVVIASGNGFERTRVAVADNAAPIAEGSTIAAALMGKPGRPTTYAPALPLMRLPSATPRRSTNPHPSCSTALIAFMPSMLSPQGLPQTA